ncbi:ABC transporter permease [Pseudonocardia sp. DLS-67]
MAAAIVGTLGRRILLLLVLLLAVFGVVALLPGNAASATLGRSATDAEIAARVGELGIDRPLPVRFGTWLGGLVTGDLGTSARGVPIGNLIGERFPATLQLGGLALAVTVVVSLLLGGWWATRPNGWLATVLSPGTMMIIAIPEFVTAILLVTVLALWLGLLPAVSASGPAALVIPVLALAIPQIGWNTRVVRAAIVDASSAPHVEAALLDGVPVVSVVRRHVLPRALPTIAASIATTVGIVLGGAIVVETIFNYPGVGSVLAGSVADRDSPLVATVVAFTGAAIMVVLLAADLVRHWVAGDPS